MKDRGLYPLKNNKLSILSAILAAVLYAISSPLSKILMDDIPPTLLASLLYIGAGIGMSIISIFRHKVGKLKNEMSLSKKELPYSVSMVMLDIAAPIFLMLGLSLTNPANVSLLNNFEIVTTSFIASYVFRESISKRLWFGISLITIASITLSLEDLSSLSFSHGSLFVLIACICWGFENNCTRMLSIKDPLQVVILKGFGSGLCSLLISILIKDTSTNVLYIICSLLLGFVAYGLSIYFYVYAQRSLGAAKTSAYYAFSPFIGVILSLIIFKDLPDISFVFSLAIMLLGAYVTSTGSPRRKQSI